MAGGVWLTRGFEEFSKGQCGNAGQNLYVSRAGILQRIHQYDFNKDGYVDLVFCNAQDHQERIPVYVYQDPLGKCRRIELPSDGAAGGVVADLNGDRYDDLVLGMNYDGSSTTDLNAIIYSGGAEGWSERRLRKIPAPFCTAVAVGDFNGDGRPDLAFLCHGKVRIYYQTELGFESARFLDLEIEGTQLGADDLDGDGFVELLVRSGEGDVKIYWGGRNGIDVEEMTKVPVEASLAAGPEELLSPAFEEDARAADAKPLVKVVRLDGVPFLFVAREEVTSLIPVGRDRTFGAALVLKCAQAMSIEIGDVNGDGHSDLVVACREPWEEGECSWVYWGNEDGFSDDRRTRLESLRACDVAVGDLDGDGCEEVVLCQNQTGESFASESPIYRRSGDLTVTEVARLSSEDARRVFIAHPSPDATPHLVFVNHYGGGRKGKVNVCIFMGGADGFSPEFRQEVPGRCAVEAICCDFNDDGWVDLALANCSEMSQDEDPGSSVFLNGPEGFSKTPSWSLGTKRAHGGCCADLDRDGYLDLVFGGFNNSEISIFRGSANGFEHPERIRLEHDGVVYNHTLWLYLADLNNDGWLDLVVPEYGFDRSFILWGGPNGFSMRNAQSLSVLNGSCVQAADLTGNGTLDLIIGGHKAPPTGPPTSFLHIYWNGPGGLREDNRSLLPTQGSHGMAVADFNNDGLMDIFVSSYDNGRGNRDIDSYIYWNRPDRGFSAADRTRLFTNSAAGCLAADFNEDGWIDLAVANHKIYGLHEGDSAVWWNGPDGFDEKHQTLLPTMGPHGMSTVDPGNVVDRGPEEHYVSRPFQIPTGSRVQDISWKAEIPSKTWVKAQIRCSECEEGLNEADWFGPNVPESWFENHQKVDGDRFYGGWIQYRLALGARNSGSTPRVSEVAVRYS